MSIVAINPPGIFKSPGLPSSIATRTTASTLIHISGQVARGSDGNPVAVGDIFEQTHQAIKNIEEILKSQQVSLKNVCRLLILVTSRDYLPAVTEVRRHYFAEPYPAATSMVVWGLARPEWLVEIEATAVVP